MMFQVSAYCQRCKGRVYVLPRRAADVSGKLMTALTLGVWKLVRRWKPERYGLWQCDECGSYKVVGGRRVRSDSDGRRVRRHRTGSKRTS